MELTAVLRAIEENPGPLVVVMDSTYVKDGLESWSKGWVRNGWRTKAGEPVKNREIWEPLLAVIAERPAGEVRFEWVKGHSGDPMNDLVDGSPWSSETPTVPVAGRRAGRRRAVGPAPLGYRFGKLADLPVEEQRAERRRRDPRIPGGYLLARVRPHPDRLGGWDPNPVADRVRDELAEVFDALARIHPDLVVLTGTRPGAELLAAEAAIRRVEVPYAAVLGFPGIDRNLSAAARAAGGRGSS
jgi:hypothetical protein